MATIQPHTKPQRLAETAATTEAAAPHFGNVSDVVAWAIKSFPNTLVILDSAVHSAQDSPYQHPQRVAELFEALDELVRRWQKDGKLGQSWKPALKELGFEYSDNISMTTRGKYADDYAFLYEGRKRLFENHVTIGAKQPESCLSVHWIRDDKKKVLVVGSCGRHGKNTSS